MGQYYRAIILNDQENQDNKETIKSWVESFDYDNGQKLMEHSWLGNHYVHAFETLIYNNPSRVVWAGDYADPENDEMNLYCMAEDDAKLKPKVDKDEIIDRLEYRYIINHTKNEYIDKSTVPMDSSFTDKKTGEVWEYYIHPLPLLTSEGNGRGGGDFHTNDERIENMIGDWARDVIEVTNDVTKTEGMVCILVNFVERHNIENAKN
jgi:hypothetical protein